MTRKTVPPPLRKYLPSLLILLALPLAGCGLFDRGGTSQPEEMPMSVEEALETTPFDSRPTVLEEMGPPDAFTIQFKELEGQIVRWESWSYFDFTTQFDFIDGELIWTIDLEPVPDGSIYAHWFDPLEFQAGMSQAEVEALFPDQDFLEIPLDAIDLEGGIALAGGQILLGFDLDQLVYVETVILSPDPDGEQLADSLDEGPQMAPTSQAAQEPTLEPSPQPSPEPTIAEPFRFEDDFESDTALAIQMFADEYMEYGNIDGSGVLTTHFPGGILPAYYSSPVLDNFILEVEIRPLSFAEGAKAGIMFRAENPASGADYYYMLSIMPASQQLWFEVWQGGNWAESKSLAIPEDLIPQYGIYQLMIDCNGNTIKVYLRDKLAGEFSSSLISDPGYFGLTIISSEDPETVLFDNLVISEQP